MFFQGSPSRSAAMQASGITFWMLFVCRLFQPTSNLTRFCNLLQVKAEGLMAAKPSPNRGAAATAMLDLFGASSSSARPTPQLCPLPIVAQQGLETPQDAKVRMVGHQNMGPQWQDRSPWLKSPVDAFSPTDIGNLSRSPTKRARSNGCKPYNVAPRSALSNGSFSRKDKSLGLLCSKFLKLYGDRAASTADAVDVSLDEAASMLGVERRRIYDVRFNVAQ
jgi:hypothetical protein